MKRGGLLSAIQAKIEEQPRGKLVGLTDVRGDRNERGGKALKAMVDTGADTVYMAKDLADEIGLSYKI